MDAVQVAKNNKHHVDEKNDNEVKDKELIVAMMTSMRCNKRFL